MAENKYTSSHTGKKIDEAIQSIAGFPDKITELNNEITANKIKINTQESAIKRINNDIEILKDNMETEQIAELSNKIDSHASQIAILNTTITATLPDEIDKVDRNLTSYKTETNKKIIDLENRINESGNTDIDQTVQNNSAQINGLISTVNTQRTEITALQQQAEGFATINTVDAIVADVKTLKNDVTIIQETDYVDLDTFNNSISSINSNIEAINNTINILDGRFDNYVLIMTYEAKITELTEQISALQDKYKELEEKINTPSE